MIQHKGYKYRIYPNKAQAVILSQFFGCCRFVYNRCLSYRKEVYAFEKRNVSQYECMRLVTQMRHDPDYAWLSSCDSMSLQESIKDLNKAFANFFEKRGGYPKFHKKSSVQTYRTRNQNGGIRIEENRIVLPKLGAVKAKISRCLKGRILSATVSRTATGKYFVSLCCEEELIPKPNAKGMIGIDLGIKELYVDSSGFHELNHKYLSKYEQKLHREQRSLSRMIEVNIVSYTKERKPIWKRPLLECSNLQKQKRRIARIHEKIYNCRNDHLHKVSSKLVNENQVIALETLNVKGMVRNHHLAKAISDASWSSFVTMLEYKAFEHGCEILKVPILFPSSQTCSSCGYKNPKVKDLKVRRWICPECGSVHDRDENAAKNILAKALSMQTA